MKIATSPRTLFSRLVLLLLFGLVLAEVITALVLTSDRGDVIKRAAGIHSAQRIAGIVRVLEQMPHEQRNETVRALDAPGMRLSLTLLPMDSGDLVPDASSRLFLRALRFYIDDDRKILLNPANQAAQAHFSQHEEFAMGMGMGSGMRDMMRMHMAESGLILSADEVHLIQVELSDGTWISFGEHLPEEMTAWPLRVIAALLLVLVTLGLVALLAVREIIRPLSHLADSALALGDDLKRPPLPVEGPEEVQRTLQAFNAMQKKIRHFVDERSRFLAAISHDLKTPITRLRLRSGLLEDSSLQQKFERDLDEMQDLVQGTLEFMRDSNLDEQRQPVDVNDLLETLQIDMEESGSTMTLKGRASRPFLCHPLSMRRMIGNVVDNAVKYGERADTEIQESGNHLLIIIRDQGPGITESDMERVLEPFTRLEESRNRTTGGNGLGLSIAQNIAKAHGGTLELSNLTPSGLQVTIRLPWQS